jgi:hypothetical protein
MKTTSLVRGNTIISIPLIVYKELKEAEFTDTEIAFMSPKERFTKFCEGEGIIGYASTLWAIAHTEE